MTVGDAGHFGGIRSRWEQFRPPKDPVAKEQKRAGHQAIKEQIKGLQSDFKEHEDAGQGTAAGCS
jgi:hypothetical protein